MVTGQNNEYQHTGNPDLLCFSHLRWNFVYQRPQHLLSRFARSQRVFFIEEPMSADDGPRLEITLEPDSVHRVVPRIQPGLSQEETAAQLESLVDGLLDQYGITRYLAWYYTPMALEFTQPLKPLCTVYDCMDELSAFKGASKQLKDLERKLLQSADLVFTGGQSLYEAKKDLHPQAYLFPSSIEVNHFGQARSEQLDPADQASIPHPRLGFFGVIDERMDLGLLASIARMRPDWHLVMIGPVAKIDQDELPKAENIHFLGMKSYKELPVYLSGWDVALLPFAMNESTRYISPTKTPEYLAGGRSVVSTPIPDVIRPYGEKGLVKIAGDPVKFVQSIEEVLKMNQREKKAWLKKVDALLAHNSWDRTWEKMCDLIQAVLLTKALETA